MKAFEDILIALLRMFAGAQILIASAYLCLALNLLASGKLRLLPPPVHEIIGIHCSFSVFVVAACGVLTWRFAREFIQGANQLGRWLAGVIGLFWGFKAFVQFSFSVASACEMRPLHLVLLMTYGFIALFYLVVAGRPVGSN